MIKWKYNNCSYRRLIFILFAVFLFSGVFNYVKAQEEPPRPPSITLVTDLSFGAFYSATGGTVTVDQYDTRTSFNTTLFSFNSYSAAHFNIYANAGTIINILSIPDFELTWSGYLMTVHIDMLNNTDPALPFVKTDQYSIPAELTIGATLSVGNPSANPPGTYSGTFNVTLVVE